MMTICQHYFNSLEFKNVSIYDFLTVKIIMKKKKKENRANEAVFFNLNTSQTLLFDLIVFFFCLYKYS